MFMNPRSGRIRRYAFEIPNRRLTDLKVIEIDPSMRLADVDRRNNKLDIPW